MAKETLLWLICDWYLYKGESNAHQVIVQNWISRRGNHSVKEKFKLGHWEPDLTVSTPYYVAKSAPRV